MSHAHWSIIYTNWLPFYTHSFYFNPSPSQMHCFPKMHLLEWVGGGTFLVNLNLFFCVVTKIFALKFTFFEIGFGFLSPTTCRYDRKEIFFGFVNQEQTWCPNRMETSNTRRITVEKEWQFFLVVLNFRIGCLSVSF